MIIASVSSGNRFELIDGNGRFVDSFGSFPKIVSTDCQNNAVFQSTMAVDLKQHILVSAYLSMDYIEVYKDTTLIHRLRGPEIDKIKVNIHRLSSGTMYSLSPLKKAFYSINIGNNIFFVGRNGTMIKKEEDYSRGLSSIFSFDFNGIPLTRYVLDRELVSFDIDYDSETLYGVTCSDNNSIVRYKEGFNTSLTP